MTNTSNHVHRGKAVHLWITPNFAKVGPILGVVVVMTKHLNMFGIIFLNFMLLKDLWFYAVDNSFNSTNKFFLMSKNR